MTNPVYLTGLCSFLPNAAVGNDQMEALLGQVGGRPSRARARVLRSNGIRSRHYALDPVTRRLTHTNAQMTAHAVRGLAGVDFAPAQIELLACGTSSPDQLMPNHAVMVHGELGIPRCEVVATAGICMSGVAAFKYGYLSVLAGQTRNAVVTGSELASSFMGAASFKAESEAQLAALQKNPVIAFEKDFLRWMLSDGAGAALLRNQPAARTLSLRVEWVEQFSYANDMPVCMYAGAEKTADGGLAGWREFLGTPALVERSVMSVKQDVRLLDEGIPRITRRGFEDLLERHPMDASDVDWLLPHYSSNYFRDVLYDAMPDGFKIPQERWFANLAERGNVGSASIFLLLDDLMRSGRLRAGQRLLCFVPESGRFSVGFIGLRVVAA
jgi:3-oxoacyl-[acyl-carrier-protein] synthase-3